MISLSLAGLLSQIFNGIQFGVLVALLATGLSLIFGMLGIINFAHGSLYMLGAYLVWSVVQVLDIPGKFWFGLVFSFIFMGFVGFIIEKFLLRRMYGRPSGLYDSNHFWIITCYSTRGRNDIRNKPSTFRNSSFL